LNILKKFTKIHDFSVLLYFPGIPPRVLKAICFSCVWLILVVSHVSIYPLLHGCACAGNIGVSVVWNNLEGIRNLGLGRGMLQSGRKAQRKGLNVNSHPEPETSGRYTLGKTK
jgi:hypothetical protein